MTHILPQELADALNTGEGAPLEVLDPNSKRTYFVVAAETHRLAMDALRRLEDREAIAEGIAEMEAGGGLPLEEARERSRARLLGRRQP